MDLVALACQEVGLDLTDTAAVDEVCSQDVWRQPSQPSWEDDISQEGLQVQMLENDASQEGWQVQMMDVTSQKGWQMQMLEDNTNQGSWQFQLPEDETSRDKHVVMPKLLSFGGDLSNTIFTDQEGKESTVALQFKSNGFSEGVSPVTNLHSQTKTIPKFLRRFNSAMISSVQGAPCRKLPDLPNASDQPKPSTRLDQQYPVLEVPPLSDQQHIVPDNNPFLHLFKDNRPGQVAFAYYVIDCLASHGGSAGVPDKEEFLSKCERWWLNLPTPYRRGYWTREVKHYKNVIIHKTWEGQAVDGRVRNHVMVNKEAVKNDLKINVRSSGIKKMNKQSSPPNMMTALKNFNSKFKREVAEELVGASGMDVRRELCKRWKALGYEEKLKYVDQKINVEVQFVDNEINESLIDIHSLDISIATDQPSHDLNLIPPRNALCDKVDPNINQVDESDKTVKIKAEEIDAFALEHKHYVEDIKAEELDAFAAEPKYCVKDERKASELKEFQLLTTKYEEDFTINHCSNEFTLLTVEKESDFERDVINEAWIKAFKEEELHYSINAEPKELSLNY